MFGPPPIKYKRVYPPKECLDTPYLSSKERKSLEKGKLTNAKNRVKRKARRK